MKAAAAKKQLKAAPSMLKPVRDRVIAAAIELIETSGIAVLTLDAVAAAAGVSKGGLLHHFRSKDALLMAVIQRHIDLHEAEWLRVAEADLDPQTREAELIKGYLQRSFSRVAVTYLSARALFGISAFNPALMNPVREYFRRRAEFIRTREPNARALLVFMLMADGLTLFDALDISPFDGPLRDEVHGFAQGLALTALATGKTKERSKAAPARRKGR